MTTRISSDTQAAREQSRDPSGRFGTQPATESDATLSTVAPLSDAQTDLLDAIKNAPYSDARSSGHRSGGQQTTSEFQFFTDSALFEVCSDAEMDGDNEYVERIEREISSRNLV